MWPTPAVNKWEGILGPEVLPGQQVMQPHRAISHTPYTNPGAGRVPHLGLRPPPNEVRVDVLGALPGGQCTTATGCPSVQLILILSIIIRESEIRKIAVSLTPHYSRSPCNRWKPDCRSPKVSGRPPGWALLPFLASDLHPGQVTASAPSHQSSCSHGNAETTPPRPLRCSLSWPSPWGQPAAPQSAFSGSSW